MFVPHARKPTAEAPRTGLGGWPAGLTCSPACCTANDCAPGDTWQPLSHTPSELTVEVRPARRPAARARAAGAAHDGAREETEWGSVQGSYIAHEFGDGGEREGGAGREARQGAERKEDTCNEGAGSGKPASCRLLFAARA